MITQSAHPDANIIWGTAFDERLSDEMSITVVATGFESTPEVDEPIQAHVDAKRAAQQTAVQQPAQPVQPVQPAAPVQQAAPAPVVEEGIPGDVVAAIMAAIHAMGNGKYTLKAVRRAANGWSKAGVNDTTAPF